MAQGDQENRFLSTLSHDLRGGLHSVQLALEMLRRDVLDGQPMDTMLADVELARRSLMDSGARAERIIVARRLHQGSMPLRVSDADVMPPILQAIRVAGIADETASQRLTVDAPPQVVIRSDPRLAGEIIGGLLDHALHATHPSPVRVSIDAGGTVEIAANRPWINDEASCVLNIVTNSPPYGDPMLGLFVAAAATRLLGQSLRCSSDRSVTLSLLHSPSVVHS